jgi:hypothetical protein
LLVLSAIVSGLVLTIYSLGVSHVNDRLEPSEMVAASSELIAAASRPTVLVAAVEELLRRAAHLGCRQA